MMRWGGWAWKRSHVKVKICFCALLWLFFTFTVCWSHYILPFTLNFMPLGVNNTTRLIKIIISPYVTSALRPRCFKLLFLFCHVFAPFQREGRRWEAAPQPDWSEIIRSRLWSRPRASPKQNADICWWTQATAEWLLCFMAFTQRKRFPSTTYSIVTTEMDRVLDPSTWVRVQILLVKIYSATSKSSPVNTLLE